MDKTYSANTYLRHGEFIFLEVMRITQDLERQLENLDFCPPKIHERLMLVHFDVFDRNIHQEAKHLSGAPLLIGIMLFSIFI